MIIQADATDGDVCGCQGGDAGITPFLSAAAGATLDDVREAVTDARGDGTDRATRARRRAPGRCWFDRLCARADAASAPAKRVRTPTKNTNTYSERRPPLLTERRRRARQPHRRLDLRQRLFPDFSG